MAHARRPSMQPPPKYPRRLASIVVHPTRMSVEPNEDCFKQVHSKRRWRRAVTPRRPVPSYLIGKCFNCLAGDHVRADCTLQSKRFTCKDVGHQARHCPQAPVVSRWVGKRGCSPALGALLGSVGALVGVGLRPVAGRRRTLPRRALSPPAGSRLCHRCASLLLRRRRALRRMLVRTGCLQQ